jgi:transporter family protein
MSWIWLALLSAVAAGLTATVGKAGLEKVDSNLGFAIQSVIILVVSWSVAIFGGKLPEIKEIDAKSFWLLLLCGAISAAGYLLYFGAIKAGNASQAAPVDRLSLVFAIVLAALFLKEKITPQIIVGAVLMSAGAIVIALAKPEK